MKRLSPETLELALHHALTGRELRLHRQMFLCLQDTLAGKVYLILEGNLAKSKNLGGKAEAYTSVYGPGNFVGNIGLQSFSKNHTEDIIALTATRIVSLSRQRLEELLAEVTSPHLSLQEIDQANVLQETKDLQDTLTIRSPHLCLEDRLHAFARLRGAELLGKGVKLTREQLSCLIGVRRENISIALNRLAVGSETDRMIQALLLRPRGYKGQIAS